MLSSLTSTIIFFALIALSFMDSHDNNNSFDLYDPDYGDINLIPWDEPNFSDRNEEDNIAGSGVDTADSREPLSLTELQHLEAVDWEMPRPFTIHLYHEAVDLGMQRIHTMCSQLLNTVMKHLLHNPTCYYT